jgi:hypothetical protein
VSVLKTSSLATNGEDRAGALSKLLRESLRLVWTPLSRLSPWDLTQNLPSVKNKQLVLWGHLEEISKYFGWLRQWITVRAKNRITKKFHRKSWGAQMLTRCIIRPRERLCTCQGLCALSPERVLSVTSG